MILYSIHSTLVIYCHILSGCSFVIVVFAHFGMETVVGIPERLLILCSIASPSFNNTTHYSLWTISHHSFSFISFSVNFVDCSHSRFIFVFLYECDFSSNFQISVASSIVVLRHLYVLVSIMKTVMYLVCISHCVCSDYESIVAFVLLLSCWIPHDVSLQRYRLVVLSL